MIDENTIATLQSRIINLERNNRLIISMFSILCVIFLLSTLFKVSPIQGKPDIQETIRAKSVEIIDNNGRTRALLDTKSDGGPCLALLDRNGIVRGRFVLYQDIDNAEIPRLVLFDEKGRTREMLGVSKDGSAVKMFDLDGQIRAIMGLSTDNNGGLILMDKDGHNRAALASASDGTPSFDLFDISGNSVFHVP